MAMRKSFLRPRFVGMIATVASAQAAVQALQSLAGLLLVRWLDRVDYAQFVLAFSVASTLWILSDIGLSSGVIALVGDRISNRRLIAEYVGASRALRTKFMWILVPVGVAAFLGLSATHDWPLRSRGALAGGVALAVWVRPAFDYYGAPLLIERRYRDFYAPQIVAYVARLGLQGLLFVTGLLNGWLAMLMVPAVLATNARSFRQHGRALLPELRRVPPERMRELIHYIQPFIPAGVFLAVQSQLVILLAAAFGGSGTLADVGALSRLAALFSVPAALSGVLVTPYLARTDRGNAVGRYARIAALGTLVAASTAAIAFLEPQLFLWVLGSQYTTLTPHVGWFVLAAALNYVAGLLSSMNIARRFVYTRLVFWEIALIAIVQIVAAAELDLGSLNQLQYFMVLTVVVTTLAQLLVGIYGFRVGPRALSGQAAAAPNIVREAS
jgi:O-antigen/teichoic acid export membrane protein